MAKRSARHSRSALLIIDMINKFDFPEGKSLLKNAQKASVAILKLKEKFAKEKLPTIYINDNFGHWKEDWKHTQSECSKSLGGALAKSLCPNKKDFFILKPKHSAFYETQLASLLEDLKVKRLIITGIAANICVLYTVNDAHSRGFEIVIPRDAVASNSKSENEFALRQFKNVFEIKTPLANQVKP